MWFPFQVLILLLIVVRSAHSLPQNVAPNALHPSQSEESQVLKTCGKREFFIAPDKCQPCPDGSYMNENQHRKKNCKPCPEVDVVYDKYVNLNDTECTREAPPPMMCLRANEYYVYPQIGSRTGDCRPCTQCEYVGRNCSRYNNTVCCPYSDMDVIDIDEGPQCVKQTTPSTSVTETEVTNSTTPPSSTTPSSTTSSTTPPQSSSTTVGQIHCGRDEYYVPENSSCQPCPQGTHQTMANHKNIKCMMKDEHEESTITLKPWEISLIVIGIAIAFVLIVLIVRYVYKSYKSSSQTIPSDAKENVPLNKIESSRHLTTVNGHPVGDNTVNGQNTGGNDRRSRNNSSGNRETSNEDYNTVDGRTERRLEYMYSGLA